MPQATRYMVHHQGDWRYLPNCNGLLLKKKCVAYFFYYVKNYCTAGNDHYSTMPLLLLT